MPQDIQITSVTCTQGGISPKFTVKWTQQGRYGSKPKLSGASGTGSGQTWTTSSTLIPTNVYDMTVVPNSGSGHSSNTLPILYYPDTGIEASFDGENLSVSWAPPLGATQPSKTRIVLNNSAGSQTVNTSNTKSVTFVVKSNLLDGDGWTVTLTPILGSAYGPKSPKTSVTQPEEPPVLPVGPNITALRINSVSDGQLTATVSTPANPGQSGDFYFVGVVSWRNLLLATSPSVTPDDPINGLYTFKVTIPGCYDVAQAFTLSLALTLEEGDNPSIGTRGPGMDLLLDEPLNAQVTVLGTGADRKVKVAVIPTDGPSKPSGVQIGLYDPSDKLIPDTEVGGDGFVHTTNLVAPVLGKGYTASAALLRGSDIGAVGKARWPLICSAPTIGEVLLGQNEITATWTSIPDLSVTGYQLIASCDGAELARAVFDGLSGCMPIPVGKKWKEFHAIQVKVQAVGVMTTGPASAAVTAISGTPFDLSAAFAATSSTCTLSWRWKDGDDAISYETEVFQGDTRVQHDAEITTTSIQVGTDVLNGGGGFHFRVRGYDKQTTRYGPWSLPAPIQSGLPSDLKVHYDGCTLSTSFTPVPGATGYQLSLVEDGSVKGDPSYIPGPSMSLPLEPAKVGDKTLAVQAVGPGTIGPATSAPVFSPGWYPRTASGDNGHTLWLNPAVASDMAAHTINIGLPDIFTKTPTGLLPQTAPFTLQAASSEQNPPYTYTLIIGGDSKALPWKFDGNATRPKLFTAYQTFLKQCETAGATPFGVQTVQAAIARSMPQTFVETLLYAYGHRRDAGCVDLVPGMLLRAEHASFQTLSRATPNQNYLNGFVPSATAEYAITRINGDTDFTALDAFIGRLVERGATTVPSPSVDGDQQAGAGGLIDSGVDAMRQPFLRLIYPRTFLSEESAGSSQPADNAMILAAPSYTRLEEATASIRKDGAIPAGAGVLYFRGRSTLTPAIRVWLDGAPITLSLGADVDDLLAIRAMNPSAVPLPLSGLRMWRGIQSALIDLPSVYPTGGAKPVRLDWALAPNKALTALPLLAGDRIVLSTEEEG